MALMDAYHDVQAVNTVAAVVFNVFLMFLIISHSNKNIGKYKYLLMAFACFEAVYALVVFVGMPINFVAEGSWMVFTHSGMLGGTSLAILGPILYCVFYETWMGFVVVHFIYRYIVVCRPNLAMRINDSRGAKIGLAAFFIGFVLFTVLCGSFFCTRLHVTHNMMSLVKNRFDIENTDQIGYIVLRKRDPEDNNSISFAGTTTLVSHFFFAMLSSSIIFFCGYQIWREIPRMKQRAAVMNDTRIQRQMFKTLVIQTLVPMIFCHVPSFIFLSFPFFDADVVFGSWSLLFCVLSSVIKWVDPIIVIVCIKQYRRAAIRTLTGNLFSKNVVGDSNEPRSRTTVRTVYSPS